MSHIQNNKEKIPGILIDLENQNKEHAENHKGFDAVQNGQQPVIVYLGCSDSRVAEPFGQGFNKIFVQRNAGNRLDKPLLSGSITYSLMHIPTTVVLYIVGHTGCGAIGGAIGDFSKEKSDLKEYLESMNYLLNSKDIVEKTAIPKGVDANLFRNTLYSEINVDYQVKKAIELYKELITAGKMIVIGGMYDIHGIYPCGKGIIHPINAEGEKDIEKVKNNFFVKNHENKKAIFRFTKY
jgi:carbonic anhydrase